MKIAVLLKPVPDTIAQVSLGGEGRTPEFRPAKEILNPYDEFAIEAAVQIAEAVPNSEVVAATASANSDILLKALAMGADRAVALPAELGECESRLLAHALAGWIRSEAFDLVWCGQQGIDADNMHLPPMLAENLGWGHVNGVTRYTLDGSGGFGEIVRQLGEGREEVTCAQLPLVLGAHKSLNKPRFTPLPKIMKAKQKPLAHLTLGDLGLSSDDLAARCGVRTEGYVLPPQKPPAKILTGGSPAETIAILVRLLRDEAGIT